MSRLFVLIRRKGSKRFIGAIPARAGTTKASLVKSIRKNINKNFTFRIVNAAQLKRIVETQRPRIAIRRGARKGRMVRRKRLRSRRKRKVRKRRRVRRRKRRFRRAKRSRRPKPRVRRRRRRVRRVIW